MPLARLSRLALAALVLAASPSVCLASRGGPDAFGYTWRDDREPGVSYTRFDFQPPPTDVFLVEPGPDGSTPFVALPWTFPFYGRNYDLFSVSVDGWISLAVASASDPTPSPLPSPDGPPAMIAPLWEPLTLGPRGNGDFMRYQVVADRLIIEWFRCTVDATGEDATFQVWLWQDGRIRFQYLNVSGAHGATIGLEEETGAIGLEVMSLGAGVDGFTVRPRSAVDFSPPSDAACGNALACGSVVNGTVRRNPDLVASYAACGYTGTYGGAEQAYTFTLTETSHVALSLTAGAAENDLFLWPACTELACLGAGDSLALDHVPPGDYVAVVDSVPGNTSFTLALACAPAFAPLACGVPQSGALGTVDRMGTWPCFADSVGGGETSFLLSTATPGDLTVAVDRPDLAVLVSSLEGFPRRSSCVSAGWGRTWVTDLPAGEWVITVDGAAGASGAFTLVADCSPPATVLDACGLNPTGTLAPAGRLDGWSCAGAPLPGGEDLYEIRLDALATLTIQLDTLAAAEVLLLDGAAEGPSACLARGASFISYPNAPPGRYVIAVDSASGGDYVLDVACDEPVGGACTPWETHDGDVPITGLNLFTQHGEEAMYALATPPPPDDPGWLPSANPSSIGYARSSSICGHTCLTALDFTYFRSYVRLPQTVTSFRLTFGSVDDGVQVRLNGAPVTFVPLSSGRSVELAGAPSLLPGALNEVLLVQVDDCCSWNELSGVSCAVSGFDPPCTATITGPPDATANPGDPLPLTAVSNVANCYDVVEYRWSSGATILRDWAPDPDYAHVVGQDDETLVVEVRCRRDPSCTASWSMRITVPPCGATLDAPAPAEACTGSIVTLAPPAPASFTNCFGGAAEYRWLAGAVVLRDWAPSPSHDHVVGVAAETLTLEARCSTRPSCATAANVDVTPLGGAPPANVTPHLRVRKVQPGEVPVLHWPGAPVPALGGHFHVYRTVYPARTWLRVNGDADVVEWTEPAPGDGWLLWYDVRAADLCERESAD